MGVLSRMGAVLGAKINALLDRSEDPAETLDYAYEHLPCAGSLSICTKSPSAAL